MKKRFEGHEFLGLVVLCCLVWDSSLGWADIEGGKPVLLRGLVQVTSERELDHFLRSQRQYQEFRALCERQMELSQLPEACYWGELWGSFSLQEKTQVNRRCQVAVRKELDLDRLEQLSGASHLGFDCLQAVQRRFKRRIYQVEGP